MKKNPTGLPSPTAWLWWTALFFLLFGVGVARLIVVFSAPASPDSVPMERLVLAISFALSGICVISATAGWWIRR